MLTPAARLAALTALFLGGLTATSQAAHPRYQIADSCHARLPAFGMRSYNDGYGEVIVSVRRGGIACDLGLERGDTIERLNRSRLSYHGSWERALRRAMADSGHIELLVRDGHSGRLVRRHIDLEPYARVDRPRPAPITPKAVRAARRSAPRATPQRRRTVGYRSRIDRAREQPAERRSPVAFGAQRLRDFFGLND